MAQDLNDWYNSLPQIFRYLFTALIIGPLIVRFSLINPMLLVADYEKVYKSFQIWRLITPSFVTSVSFMWAINLYIFYNYGKSLSETTFTGRPADEAFMYFVLIICCDCVGWFFGEITYYIIFTSAVIYVWTQCNRDVIASFYFGIQLKAAYLSWAMAAFNFLLHNQLHGFYGILVGHIYFFLKYKWPVDFGGRDFLVTPSIFKTWFPEFRQVAGRNIRFQQPEGTANRDNTRDGNGHNWGSGGHRLGD